MPRRTVVNIPSETHRRLRVIAAHRGKRVQELVDERVIAWVDREYAKVLREVEQDAQKN